MYILYMDNDTVHIYTECVILYHALNDSVWIIHFITEKTFLLSTHQLEKI